MLEQVAGANRGQHKILVVEDTKEARQLLNTRLQREGFTVLTASRGAEALELVKEQGLPHLAIVDILMPGMDGMELASHLRRMGDLPIVFLSALADPAVKTDAINRYAEDYVTKPFYFAELLARVRRILLRSSITHPSSPEEMLDARLRVNFAQRYIIAGSRRIALTPTENRILHILYANRGRIVSPETLLAKVWNPNQKGTLDSLWVHIRRLRDKIEQNPDRPRYLVTMCGQGYCLLKQDQMGAANEEPA
jgi:DNA-binding response OmpR family regulator